MKKKNEKPKLVSLFSGAMGLDLGLEKAGFETVLCVENNDKAVETIRRNRPTLPVIHGSVVDVTAKEILKEADLNRGEISIVAGGPPCQSFSVFGNRLGVIDKRGQMIFEFQRIVKELNPKVFVMENVRGLLSVPAIPKSHAKSPEAKANPELLEKGSLIKLLFKEFENAGYRIDCFEVNSVNYGAPQIRERVFLIGNRFGLTADFPAPTHSNRVEDALIPFKTLGDAIGKGFKDSDPSVMNFSPRKLKYLAMVPPGGNWRSMPVDIQKESMGKSWYLKGGRSAYWRKLSFAFPSPTVVTMPNHAGTSMCHPTELRAISVGEAAAIQEFPKDWKFAGSTTEKFKQIGNAVPVRLGAVAGNVAMNLLKRIELGEKCSQVKPSQILNVRSHVRTRTFWKDGKVYSGDHCYYEIKELHEIPDKSDNKEQLKLSF